MAPWVEMCQPNDEEEDDFASDASVLFKTVIDACETVNIYSSSFPEFCLACTNGEAKDSRSR